MIKSNHKLLKPVFWGILMAFFIGLFVGFARYWIGYYVLIQGVLAGMSIPWLVKITDKSSFESFSLVRFKMASLLFILFLLGQAVGFGLAQPVFDPFNWLARVWAGDTVESVFGIYTTGGVVSHAFAEGLSGGFWLLLSSIDLFFMFFFILIGMPLKTKK